MNLNIVDVIIILFILLSVITGLKKGFIRETISFVGTLLVLVLSYTCMGSVASFLYISLPFLNLGFFGIVLSSLNILVFQIFSFALCFILFSLILRIVLTLTNIADKIINTLVLFKGISSILGAIVGLISGILVTFVILIIVSIPLYKWDYFHDSKVASFILNHTLIASNVTTNIRTATSDVYNISTTINSDKDYKEHSNMYNLQILDTMLKYNVISYDNVKYLDEHNKLDDMTGKEEIIEKYKK